MKKWIAVVFCQKKDDNRVLASFLVLQASNKFQANQKMLASLPDNPEYLDECGNLRPHTVIDLRCIRDHEERKYREAFAEMIEHVFYSDSPFIPGVSA